MRLNIGQVIGQGEEVVITHEDFPVRRGELVREISDRVVAVLNCALSLRFTRVRATANRMQTTTRTLDKYSFIS